jgi:hypothetical protein
MSSVVWIFLDQMKIILNIINCYWFMKIEWTALAELYVDKSITILLEQRNILFIIAKQCERHVS